MNENNIILLIIFSFLIGILFVYLLKYKRNFFQNPNLYFLLRVLVIGLLVTPTILGAGHGVIPINALMGIIIVIVGNGESYKFAFPLIMFGKHGGGSVILLPCLITFVISFFGNIAKNEKA